MVIERLEPDDSDDKQTPHVKPEILSSFEEERKREQDFSDNLQAQRIRGSVFLRLFMVLMVFISLFVIFINVFVYLTHTLICLVTRFRNNVLVVVWRKAGVAVFRWTVICIGSLISVASPAMGISLILRYLLSGTQGGIDPIARLLRTRFSNDPSRWN
jgi:hypothetical protein